MAKGQTKAQLLRKIAQLESINDLLTAEVSYVDQLMRAIGFAGGLMTVKQTAQELLNQDNSGQQKYL